MKTLNKKNFLSLFIDISKEKPYIAGEYLVYLSDGSITGAYLDYSSDELEP